MNPQNQRTAGLLVVVIVGIVALAAPRLRSQSAGTDQSERFQKSFAIASGGTLDVNNYKGTIHVTGSDTNQVAVKYPEWNWTFCWPGHDFTASVELEIHVPRQINVKLESYKPDIKIASI